LDAKINAYLKNYSWNKTFVLLPREPLSKNELLQRIKESATKAFLDEFETQEKAKKRNLELEKRLIKIISEDKKVTKLVELNKELGWLLTWSVEELLRACNDSAVLFRDICRRFNISYQDWGIFYLKRGC